MNWYSSDILWWLLLVPILITLLVWGWRSRIQATQRFGSTSTAQQMVAGRSAWFRAAKAVILILGISLVFMAIPLGGGIWFWRKQKIDAALMQQLRIPEDDF